MGTESERRVFVPIQQETISFYGHELVAVLLADGTICAVLRWLCDGLQLDTSGQIERAQRKAALADGLVTVRVNTAGGAQEMPALTLDVLPGFLFTIDETRVKAEAQPDVILFQRECVKALADYFMAKHAARLRLPPAQALVPVPADAPREPVVPSNDAPREVWRAYHRDMLAFFEWQDEIERWRAESDGRHAQLEQRQGAVEGRVVEVEQRMETVESHLSQLGEVSRLVPALVEQFAAAPLSPAHQEAVQRGVNVLADLTGKTHASIYNELRQSFKVGTYKQIPDARWPDLRAWFRPRLEAAQKRAGVAVRPDLDDQPEQPSLFS